MGPMPPVPVFEPTASQRDAASAIFNLPDHRVIAVVDQPDGVRRIEVQSVASPGLEMAGL